MTRGLPAGKGVPRSDAGFKMGAYMNTELRDRYAIVGVGQSRLGEVPGSTALSLMMEAAVSAMADAGIEKGGIDGIICRGPDDMYGFHQQVGQLLGTNVGFSTTLDNGGASQILSIILAISAIEAGMCNTVLCGYARDAWSRTHSSEEARMSQRASGAAQSLHARDIYSSESFGLFGAPAMHALGARRHMDLYGTTKDQLGAVAVAFREHARRNPLAQMHAKQLTLEDYRAGRPIVEPFNLFDCSLRSDAAGAVIVTSLDKATDFRKAPVRIRGFGTHNNLSGWFHQENMTNTAAIQSSKKAYSMAGLGPSDIDVFEVYDCFTYMALVQLEDYGFCQKGEGGPYVESGALRLGGALPTNTAGGQLSEGHAEGMLQIVEAARQVRRDYGPDRQVENAEVALVSGHGGNTVCHSSLILACG
ncbi:MAG: thiolase family protein [Acidimicrobiaceae bacterium]|nr:thiolase family protein [Acidimicrobiaceae bacterium]